METIIICWLAPICAYIGGLMLAVCNQYGKNSKRRYLLFLKILLSIYFLISLILGYLGSMHGITGQEYSFWSGLLGAVAMAVPAYLGYSAGYPKYLFCYKKWEGLTFSNKANFLANVIYLAFFIAGLILWKIKIGLIIPAAFFWTALAAAIVLMIVWGVIMICVVLISGIVFAFYTLAKIYHEWLKD